MQLDYPRQFNIKFILKIDPRENDFWKRECFLLEWINTFKWHIHSYRKFLLCIPESTVCIKKLCTKLTCYWNSQNFKCFFFCDFCFYVGKKVIELTWMDTILLNKMLNKTKHDKNVFPIGKPFLMILIFKTWTFNQPCNMQTI